MKISETFCSLKTTATVILLGVLLLANTKVNAQNNALDFDGTDDYVELPNTINGQITGNNVTIEGWFYLRAAIPRDYVQLVGETYLGNGVDDVVKFSVFFEESDLKVGFVTTTAIISVGAGPAFSAADLNKWIHIAGTYDGDNLRVYLNGNPVKSVPETRTLPTTNGNWVLGRKTDTDDFFNGKMDEVRIWNVARSGAEILANYRGQVPATQPGLVAYYKMDQGVAGGDNTLLPSVTDSATFAPNDSGTFKNFTLNGSTSNFVETGIPTVYNGGWSQGAPNATRDAVIEGNYSVAANLAAKTLTVNNSAVVTIPSGNNVTVTDAVTVTAPATFTLSSNANLIQVNNVINTGEIAVNRDSSPLFRLDYTLWSSPVTGAQTLGGFSPLTSTNRFYDYNTSTNLYNGVSNGISFGLAKGYLIRMPNEDPLNLGLGTPYYLGNSALTYNGVFTGTPNNGPITYTMSTDGLKYNAVGNPYPSTINMVDFITANAITNANIDGTLYFWRKKNNALNGTSYSTCTTGGCILANGHTYTNDDFISAGQGFIVNALTTTLNFTNSMRIANNQNQFFRTKLIEKNRIWLNLSDATSPINQMMVAYMTGATQGVDAAIDGKYFNDSQTALNSLIGSEEFAIQGRSLPFDGTDVVPLAFKTTTAGNYTIAIDRVDGLFTSGQDVYLVDSKTGTETNLTTTAYTFTATAGVDNTRFSLKYQKTLKVDTPALNENSVSVYTKNGTLYVNAGEIAINNIQVYDVQGRLLAERRNVKASTATLDNLKANNQVLLVKISGVNNEEVTKKVLN